MLMLTLTLIMKGVGVVLVTLLTAIIASVVVCGILGILYVIYIKVSGHTPDLKNEVL